MVTHQHDPLDLVTALPREDWSDAYIVLMRVLKRFDPAKGELSHLFRVAWMFAKRDRFRRETSRGRKTVRTVQFDHEIDFAAPVKPSEVEESFAVQDVAHSTVFMYAHGHTIEQMSRAIGVPKNTIKTRLFRFRKLNRDNA